MGDAREPPEVTAGYPVGARRRRRTCDSRDLDHPARPDRDRAPRPAPRARYGRAARGGRGRREDRVPLRRRRACWHFLNAPRQPTRRPVHLREVRDARPPRRRASRSPAGTASAGRRSGWIASSSVTPRAGNWRAARASTTASAARSRGRRVARTARSQETRVRSRRTRSARRSARHSTSG